MLQLDVSSVAESLSGDIVSGEGFQSTSGNVEGTEEDSSDLEHPLVEVRKKENTWLL